VLWKIARKLWTEYSAHHLANFLIYFPKRRFYLFGIRFLCSGMKKPVSKSTPPGFIDRNAQHVKHVFNDVKTKTVEADYTLVASEPHQSSGSPLHFVNAPVVVVRLHQHYSEEGALLVSHGSMM